jgi:hypothetical protein
MPRPRKPKSPNVVHPHWWDEEKERKIRQAILKDEALANKDLYTRIAEGMRGAIGHIIVRGEGCEDRIMLFSNTDEPDYFSRALKRDTSGFGTNFDAVVYTPKKFAGDPDYVRRLYETIDRVMAENGVPQKIIDLPGHKSLIEQEVLAPFTQGRCVPDEVIGKAIRQAVWELGAPIAEVSFFQGGGAAAVERLLQERREAANRSRA